LAASIGYSAAVPRRFTGRLVLLLFAHQIPADVTLVTIALVGVIMVHQPEWDAERGNLLRVLSY
jgi:threonine/homoserine efflux transporter RhtA